MKSSSNELQIQQVNCFYNYTIGLDVIEVDLLKTGSQLLASGLVRSVFFSDLKALYSDKHGGIHVEWIRPEGRQWDSQWTVKFEDSLPEHIIHDFTFCLELYFHELRVEGAEVKQKPPYLRASLPPFILERSDLVLPLYPWLTLYNDGIMIISFQLDTTCEELKESEFIKQIVNLFQCYFEQVWIKAEIQRMDAESILPHAFLTEMSIGSQNFFSRKTKKLLKNMRKNAKAVLEDSLRKAGRNFELHDEPWTLHQIAGTENQTDWEATMDLCRSIYANAIISKIVAIEDKRNKLKVGIQLWQGRPSISLMRFSNQPQSKEELLKQHSLSISRILMRSPEVDNPMPLPKDLRPFEDYCLHGTRALLLWTWTKRKDASEDAWDELNTLSYVSENQVRAEHFEYHNMRIARACSLAGVPLTDEKLIYAYETLASSESVLHQLSQAGEITDALEYLINAFGTGDLVESAKEHAKWHLNERRFRNEQKRVHIDRSLTVVFGFVGATGMADLFVQPLLKNLCSDLADWVTGLIAFALALFIVGVLVSSIWMVSKTKK